MERFTETDRVFEWFLSFHNAERTPAQVEFRLDRIKAMLALFGSPERSCPVYHVAGSKGKGSVTSMVSSILSASGKRTGLYLSPHVTDYRERITLNGTFLGEKGYLEAGNAVLDWFAGEGKAFSKAYGEPTYFELMTLLAFLAYRDSGCERLALETGLGGRLDATNAVDPAACLLTPIELEHVEYLGDTLGKIAGEKAGIMKKGRPAFSSAQPPEAELVFRSRSRDLPCPFATVGEAVASLECEVSRAGTDVRIAFRDGFPFGRPIEARLPLVGEIQAGNAALAALAVGTTEPGISPEDVERGLSSVRLPARFEIVSADPFTALDGAHTPSSTALAASTFERVNGRGPCLLLFACASDKDADGMARSLAPLFRDVIVTRPGTFKASDPDVAAAAFKARGCVVTTIPETETAIEAARARGLPLLVTGSFYLCAIAREAFMPSRPK